MRVGMPRVCTLVLFIYFVLYTLVPLVGLSYETLTLVCFAAVPISSELHLALRPQDTHGPCLFQICLEHYVLSTKLQSCQYIFIAVYT